VTDFTKKLMKAGLGDSIDAKTIQKWLSKLSLKEKHKTGSG
jgi:hypothetical protein